VTLEEATHVLQEAYKSIVKHYQNQHHMSAVKLMTTANTYVFQKCMEAFGKMFADK
jgi:predicted metal-dependent HD superfamily phosphohydrolase